LLRWLARPFTRTSKRLAREASFAARVTGATVDVWLDLDMPDPNAPPSRRMPSDDAHARRDPFRGGPQPPLLR